jgi:4-amino-4-deoxy-L-arabinose transferase-like glycosyltransferase
VVSRPTWDAGRRRPLAPVVALAALVAVGAVGAVARIAILGEPMRYDEAFTVLNYVGQSVGFITSHYGVPNNHILYSLSAHGVWRIAGDHIWTVRLPALVAGIALIPTVYLAAVRLYDRRAAAWAAGIVAGIAPLVYLSANGRGYVPGIALSIAALWLAARLLEARGRSVQLWLAYVVCCALAVYFVPTMAYAVATVTAWAAAVALLRRAAWTASAFVLATAVAAGLDVALYSAVLGARGWDAIPALGSGGRPAPGGVASAYDLVDAAWASWNRGAPHPLDWLVTAGFLASLVLHRRLARHPVPLAVPAALVALGVYGVDRAAPFPRSWTYLLPLYAIQAGAGLSYAAECALRRRPRSAILALTLPVALAAALAIGALHAGDRGDVDGPQTDNDIVGFLKRELRPGQVVLLERYRVEVPSSYYFRRFGYRPPSLPRRHAPTRVLVIVPRSNGVAQVYAAAAERGWRVRQRPRPRLVRRLEYIEAWDARLE